MAAKRKISIRKILQVFLTLVVTTCCVIAMVSASRIEDSKTVKSVAIHFKNDKRYHFIEEQEIMDLAINNRHTDIEHTPISRLDIHTMEQLIMADPWVAHAQVFIDNEHVLHMYVTQRIPVARVFQDKGVSFYLDTTLSIMPLSPNYKYYTTVVTNVPELTNDSAGWALRKDIISLVRTIQADSFWSAQISHVIIDSDRTFELVPILGDQRILFGDATRMKEKFDNLFAFYKNVLNRIGWDKYEKIDVRYAGQVVASPSLPCKGPVDKAAVNMNWVNSIVETEARKDSLEGKTGKDKQEPSQPKLIARPTVKPIHPIAHAGKVVAKNMKHIKKEAKGKKEKDKAHKPKYIYPEKKK